MIPAAGSTSTWSRRTRLGTEASLAGVQKRLMHSIRKLATNSQAKVSRCDTTRCARGLVRNKLKRSRAQTTIVMRRAHRAAA